MGDVMVAGWLGHNDQKMVKLKILTVLRKKKTSELLPWTSGDQTSMYK